MQKKRRLALPKAEVGSLCDPCTSIVWVVSLSVYRQIYRQTSSSGRSKPKTTSSVSYHGFTVTTETISILPQFAATLDKEALYMGKKRKALSPKAVTGNSKVGRT